MIPRDRAVAQASRIVAASLERQLGGCWVASPRPAAVAGRADAPKATA